MKKTLLAAAVAGLAALCASAADDAGTTTQRVLVRYRPGAEPTAETRVGALGGRVHLRLLRQGFIAATLPVSKIAALRNDPNVLSVEPDPIRRPMGQVVPYGIAHVQAPDAWAVGVTGAGVKVCIIDSGINAHHEEFAGIPMTGYPTGWDSDSCGHGTHVAGTIAAANNATGVVGVSPGRVSLHIVKVFNGASCGWSYASSLIDAANRCADAGAKVINMSLGGPDASSAEQTAFDNLYARGVLSIAAAGNDGNTAMSYPASYPSVMSVAAVDENDVHADFSQSNAQVDIAAPGVGVLSTYPMRSASLTVMTRPYTASAMEGSAQRTASSTLVNGGRCATAGAWAGRIVLCERGDVTFAVKAASVVAGGGVAAVVYNNVPGGFAGTLGGNSTIPALSITREDGLALVAHALGRRATVSSVLQSNVSGYDYLDGTSMATPHVSGAAAVVWSANPSATNTQVRDALLSTALDLGAVGRDNLYGYGRVRVLDAIAALVGAPPSPPAPASLAVNSASRTHAFAGVALAWGGGAGLVDVWRDSQKIAAAINNVHAYGDRQLGLPGTSGTHAYRVCNTGTTTCSNTVSTGG